LILCLIWKKNEYWFKSHLIESKEEDNEGNSDDDSESDESDNDDKSTSEISGSVDISESQTDTDLTSAVDKVLSLLLFYLF
jgi:hypothetical protein